jgi:hypothetical protein
VSVGNLVVKNAGWLLVPDPDSKDEFVRMRGYQVSYLCAMRAYQVSYLTYRPLPSLPAGLPAHVG